MFVAGLWSSSGRDRSASSASASNVAGPSSRGRAGTITSSDPAVTLAQAPLAAFTSPRSLQRGLPSSPPAVRSPPLGGPTSPREDETESTLGKDVLAVPDDSNNRGLAEQATEGSERDVEFETLLSDLRGSLEGLGEKTKVWLPYDKRKNFRIVMVDKVSRKAPPQSTVDQAPHSTLSPYTTTSPMCPDGLISPIWIRKHAEMVPSVFVLFLRLYEVQSPSPDLSPEHQNAFNAEEKQREKELDEMMIREIADRRRRLGERGIKLTVVLMASAITLDSPTLDARLSHLRRSSSLSSKASLFVLTPVPADQLAEFVASLQESLYDSAMEYYANHIKKIRRKRGRIAGLPQFTQPSVLNGGIKMLGPHGWAVRYDWKAAWFSEIRGDLDIARRYYEECWNELVRMFSSTQILPPRSKRWAEAKVLADCVAIRICRLWLYSGESTKVLEPFNLHLHRFGDLSRGWGIGEETYEFWSWLSREYRIFAELLEEAVKQGHQITPSALPTFPTPLAAAHPPTPDYYATPTSSANPLMFLQGPAYYYYTAAACSVERKRKFEDALSAEVCPYSNTPAPGLNTEKTVDHAALIGEVSRIYADDRKKRERRPSRVALYMSFRMAEVYCQAGQYEMVMSHFDKLAEEFRRDGWPIVVRQIRELWYEAAQRTGNVEVAARLLWEMLAPSSGVETEDRSALQEDILSLLRTTKPSTAEPLIVTFVPSSAFLDIKAGFWERTCQSGQTAPFQITLACPEEVDISNIRFTKLKVVFSDEKFNSTVVDSPDITESVTLLDLGMIQEKSELDTIQTALRWTPGHKLTIHGQVGGVADSEIKITSVILELKESSWDIQIVFTPDLLDEWSTRTDPLIPLQELSPTISFIPRPHNLDVEIQYHPSGYVDEVLPIMIKVTNPEDVDLEIQMSVLLQSGEPGDTSTITFDRKESTNPLQNLPLGILSQGNLEKILYLRCPKPASKTIEISIQSSLSSSSDKTMEEIQRTLIIPFLYPFMLSSTVQVHDTDLSGRSAVISSVISCPGPRPLHVESLKIQSFGNEEITYTSSSLEVEQFPQLWDQDTAFSLVAKFVLQPKTRRNSMVLGGIPAELVFQWRTDSSSSLIQSSLLFPPISLPRHTQISAIISHPPSASLIQSFNPILTLKNHTPRPHVLNVLVEPTDMFVWSGPRNMHVTVGGGEEKEVGLIMRMIGQEGWRKIPNVRVWEEGIGGRSEIVVGGKEGKVLVRP
ncbi:hypothetical protein TREMEDRAFT_44157 [Tremella mesenterica DSM 1558]|uniref:uncharacterized protein n=1 Tax=Tremella mesenterica (strain ATCC 24925 / CBS 8224 / DSM 1558 / NBRC 9311 / NRRL Y-6157 / RJB 2259-6 / UBC 559-6) TaxID=578456 RepID=UPI0003F4A5B2|nr:uncharacterized protein TREMEDRAFT_44157 [Tremella mesenterica DSM 1558]EIW69677.1 hypothetical protein TREMEDRAFT_44157 [Tremella mesenterica DSM 1558]